MAISDLTVILNGIAILDRVTAMIPEKGCTAVVGPNGAGKTTLFLALLGQIPHRGAIRFPAWPARPRFGYVPQRLELDPGLPITAGEFLRLSRGPLPLWLPSRRAERNRAENLLSLVGLEHCRDRRVGELSGGELQRLLVALALGRNPEILLLDEATSAADAGNREELWRLMDRLRREMGFVQIMISHDFPSVTAYADRLICLNHRVLAEGDAADFRANGGLASIFPGPASPAPAPLRESCHA
ncbi:MAG: metal ABC transporter ATP-binding protein [Planctomycetota bacterium]|nr:metal ABC transporter ATP-binding protein [Planctomycetota bacterium]